MKLIDLQKQTATVTSAATITLGAALDKFRTVAQAIAAGDIAVSATGVSFFVRDPATGAFESGEYTITDANTLTQTKRTSSSNNGQAVAFGGAACEVYSAAAAASLNALLSAADGVTGSQLTAIASVVKLLALDVNGNIGTALAAPVSSFLGAAAPADTTAPSVPGSLSTSGVSQTAATLNWSASTDNSGAAPSYEVSRDGASWTAVAAGTLLYAFGSLTAATLYTLQVRAVDGSGNRSAAASIQVTTSAAAGGDVTAPTIAGSITTSSVTATGFTMAYPAGSDNVAVTRYDVSTDGGTTWINNGTNLSYPKTGATASTLYNLRVRCADAAGNLSNVLAGTVTTSAAAGPAWQFYGKAFSGVPTSITYNGGEYANISGDLIIKDSAGTSYPTDTNYDVYATLSTSSDTAGTLPRPNDAAHGSNAALWVKAGNVSATDPQYAGFYSFSSLYTAKSLGNPPGGTSPRYLWMIVFAKGANPATDTPVWFGVYDGIHTGTPVQITVNP